MTAEEARKASLEQRGVAVISTAGALASVLFAAAALLTSLRSFAPPRGILPLFLLAAVAFLVSAFLALATNLPLRYREIDVPATLAEMKAHWDDDEAAANARTTATRGLLLQTAERANSLKAWLLVAAMFFEGLALVPLGIAVASLL